MSGKIRKATTHVIQNEGLIFEKSSPGKKAYKLPELDVPDVNPAKLLGNAARAESNPTVGSNFSSNGFGLSVNGRQPLLRIGWAIVRPRMQQQWPGCGRRAPPRWPASSARCGCSIGDRRRRLEVHPHLFSELAETAGRGGHRLQYLAGTAGKHPGRAAAGREPGAGPVVRRVPLLHTGLRGAAPGPRRCGRPRLPR